MVITEDLVARVIRPLPIFSPPRDFKMRRQTDEWIFRKDFEKVVFTQSHRDQYQRELEAFSTIHDAADNLVWVHGTYKMVLQQLQDGLENEAELWYDRERRPPPSLRTLWNLEGLALKEAQKEAYDTMCDVADAVTGVIDAQRRWDAERERSLKVFGPFWKTDIEKARPRRTDGFTRRGYIFLKDTLTADDYFASTRIKRSPERMDGYAAIISEARPGW